MGVHPAKCCQQLESHFSSQTLIKFESGNAQVMDKRAGSSASPRLGGASIRTSTLLTNGFHLAQRLRPVNATLDSATATDPVQKFQLAVFETIAAVAAEPKALPNKVMTLLTLLQIIQVLFLVSAVSWCGPGFASRVRVARFHGVPGQAFKLVPGTR